MMEFRGSATVRPPPLAACRIAGRVVLVCADSQRAGQLSAVLETCGCQVLVVFDRIAFDAALGPDCPAAVVLDLDNPVLRHDPGLWDELESVVSRMAVALLAETTAANANAVAQALACGALVLPPSIAPIALPQTLARAVANLRLRDELHMHRARLAHGAGLQRLRGESIEMLRVKTQVRLWMDQEVIQGKIEPVLLLGQAGTGKCEVARALHYGGPRRDQPFIIVDSVVLSDHDTESVLFGSSPATPSNPGQVHSRGLWKLAAGGTLFVDELAQLGLATQRRLLQVLAEAQQAEYPVPLSESGKPRLVVATSHEPSKLEYAGRLLPELHQLLKLASLRLVPLQDREGDIGELFRCFVEEAVQASGRPMPIITPAAMNQLTMHGWSGQLRELRLVADGAVVMQRHGRIDVEQLEGLITTSGTSPTNARSEQKQDLNLHRVERETLELALQRARGNVSEAARLLGVSRDTLRFRISRHGLTRGPSG